MIVAGFDPGLTGAVAFIGPAGASVHDLPTLALPAAARAGKSFVPRRIDGRALALLVRQHAPLGEQLRAYCERVQAMRGGSGNSAIQAEGSLMRTLGAIEAVCDVLCASPELVLPQAWQAFYGLVGKGVELRERGALPAATRKALELYPYLEADLSRVKDHNRAEAVLIAHYAARKLVPR